MRLGLGIGVPYGSGVPNSDRLSLDLQFAADKTLTPRKGPTPTFTRASTATYFAPSLINAVYTFGGNFNVNLSQTTLINGRYNWENGDTGLYYTGTAWLLSHDGNTVATSAPTSNAWRPDLANWSGTGAVITPTSTFGIVKSAVNEPRFDHDPATLACKGLLIEESRTNLALQSETFPLPTWAKTNVTTSPNTLASPSGTVSADTLIEDTATSFHYISQQFAKAASSLTYSFSVYYKNDSGTRTVALALTNGTTSGKAAIFTTSGTITATNVNISGGVGFTFVSASVESVGNGWYRASVVVTSDTSTRLDAVVYLNNSTTVISSYTGILSSVYLWGAQLELGSFPTSYIPTTTTALPRSTDLCSITGSNFTGFWNQSAGTLVESFEASPNTNTSYASASNGNIIQNSLHLDNGTGVMRAVYYSGSSTVATLSLGAIGTVGAVNTISTAYSVNDFAASRNGAAVVVDTSGAVPASLTQINIGADERSQTPTSYYSNRCIKYLRYYKKRLPDAKLQSLTQFASDPDANAYIVSLLAAGATLNTPQQNAINTFVSGEKTAGRWDGHKRIHFPVWQLAAANAICMKSLTSGTFTGSFQHTNRGVNSFGSSYFRTAGQFLTPLGISKSSYHISYMVTNQLNEQQGLLAQNFSPLDELNISWLASYTSNDDNVVESMFVNLDTLGFNASITSYTLAGGVVEPIGIISVSGNGSSQYAKHRNVLGVSTKGTGSIVQSGSISEFANDFMGSQYGGGDAPTCGLLSLGTHMTTEQDSLFTAAAKTLWENVTGFTLPTP